MTQKITAMLVLLLISMALSGCGKNAVTVTVDDTGATEEGIKNAANANNQFAFEYFSKLNEQGKGNLFFSPWSISSALAMTYEGAKGKTADEMQLVFHFETNNNLRRSSFASLYSTINKKDKEYRLNTANALWAQKDYPFLEEYFAAIGKYYGGKVTNLDFKTDAEQSRITINSWVEKQTNDKIKNIIAYLDPATRLVLTNAIYFKGEWAKAFEKESTYDEDFRSDSGKFVQVKMMKITGKEAEFSYAENKEMQIIELPYKGNELSMIILLPKDNNPQLFDTINANELSILQSKMYETRVDVYLPKFKFDTKYFMKKDLEEMGMPNAFTDSADFSGMTGQRDLYISEVIHQAFVDVNEEGTEAAAATVVVMRAMAPAPGSIKIFKADHPFLFIIQEKSTGSILFIGKVANPAAS
jgi:serpin B